MNVAEMVRTRIHPGAVCFPGRMAFTRCFVYDCGEYTGAVARQMLGAR